jgi:hypothetical protein
VMTKAMLTQEPQRQAASCGCKSWIVQFSWTLVYFRHMVAHMTPMACRQCKVAWVGTLQHLHVRVQRIKQ